MLAGFPKGFTLSRPRAVPSRTSPPQLGQKVRIAAGLRSHLHLKASASQGSSSAVFGKIFDRKEELAALKLRFDKNPKDMLILLGPANCGKTKLLQEAKKDRELGQAVIGEGPPPILHLNCRKKDISSPQQFANAIRELVTTDTAFGKWWKAVKIKFPYIQVDLGTLFGPADDPAPPMASIIASLTTFLEATRPLPYKHVIIIDEANVLLDWHDDPGRTQLKALLRFFVATTKEDHLGHFVLASSESFLIDFLEKEGLHTKQYVTQEIGDLATIDEAKQFVESLMLCKTAPSSFFDTTENGEQTDMWPRVYEVCGGNIGLLERCAEYANDIGSWEKGLRWVSRDLEGAVKRGLSPEDFPTNGSSRSPAAWTEEDYKTVLREIALAKEHKHAVSFEKLRKMVGKKAVRSMVEWNLVALRRKSDWAKDLPETVFTDLKDMKLVMMPSPAELYWILKMYDDGELDAAPPKDDKDKETSSLRSAEGTPVRTGESLLANLTRYVVKLLEDQDSVDGEAWSACLVSVPGDSDSLEAALDSSAVAQRSIVYQVGSIGEAVQAVLVYAEDAAVASCENLGIDGVAIKSVISGVYDHRQESRSCGGTAESLKSRTYREICYTIF